MLSTSGAYDFAMDRLTRPDLSPPGTRTINMNELAEALAGELPGPAVKALYVYNCNPAAVAPNQRKVLEGLKREDLFVVVHELFATDTVDYADIVLPATSQLEHEDLHGSYGHHEVMYNPRTIAPRGECRSNNDVFRALAARLGLEPEFFPDDATLIREVLDGGPTLGGITLERLQAEGSVRLNLPARLCPVRRRGFSDPVGQVRALLRADEGRRTRPVTHVYPAARRSADPARAGRKVPAATAQSAPSAVPELDLRQQPEASLSGRRPDRRDGGARRTGRGLSDGQWAEVFNDRGAFQARVALTGNVQPGVAVATGIYWNKLSPGRSNVNSTTSSALADMAGGATFFDNLVEIRSLSAVVND